MALLDRLLRALLLFSLLFGYLVTAQTETIYLTQISTVFTACECANTSPTGLTPLLPVSSEKDGSLSSPAIVSVLGSSSFALTVLGDGTSTMTGTFPVFSVLSSSLAMLPSDVSLAPVSTLLSTPGMATSAVATVASPISLSNGLGPLLSTATTALLSPLSTSEMATSMIATVASPVSLSNGLGPLLSSASSIASAAVTASPSLPLSLDTGSTTIQVVSSTIAATIASSKLTTSGIPESLSINLSAIGSDPALESSAALISFGTSSPAIFSTILPSGQSRGTSSETMATYSTVSLNGLSLTGVTLLSPRSPTSCFTLPTPVSSMDMLAIAVVPQTDYSLANPMIFAFGDNGTLPEYVSAMSSGNPYVLDLSSDNIVTGQLGLQIPGDEALVFDGSGISLYTGNCSTLTQVAIDNFYSQLRALSGGAAHTIASKFEKRQIASPENFTVAVAVDSYLKTTSFSSNLTFGNTRCTPQSASTIGNADNITWSCMYPPPLGDTALCTTNLNSWLSDIAIPAAHPHNATEVLAMISPFLSSAGDSIMALFPGADPALGLGLKFMQQVEAATKEAIGDVGFSTCDVLHEYDSDDLVLEDGGPLGTQTIGSFMTSPPAAVVINLQASATASITALPPRKVNPTDNFLKQIATDFRSIFGAFTSWLGGLHLFVEETGIVRIRPVAATPTRTMTITSIATLATPSLVRIEIPTVTVTHVLGDGWLSPSTYVVGPGSSTMPQIPTIATQGPDPSTSQVSSEDYNVSASSPTYAPSDLVDLVIAQLAALHYGDAAVQTGHRWDLPTPQSHQTGTTTPGASLGYDGHVVIVTTTITIMNSGI